MKFALFALAVLPVLANFADFLLGVPGDRQLRQRIFRFYLAVEGSWQSLYRTPANLVALFLDKRLGTTPLRFCTSVVAYSAVLTLFTTPYHVWRTPKGMDSSGWAFLDISVIFWGYLLPNIAGDLVSRWSTRQVLRSLRNASVLKTAVLSLCLIIIAAASFSLAARIEYGNAYGYRNEFWDTPYADFSPFAVHDSVPSIERIRLTGVLAELGFDIDSYTFDYWGVVPLTVIMPAILFASVVFGALVLIACRPLLRGPTSLILARLEASQKGLLSSIGLAISAIAICAVAASKF